MKPAKLSDIYDALEPKQAEPVRAIMLGDLLKALGIHYVVTSTENNCVVLGDPLTGVRAGDSIAVANPYRLTRVEASRLCSGCLGIYMFLGRACDLVTIKGA